MIKILLLGLLLAFQVSNVMAAAPNYYRVFKTASFNNGAAYPTPEQACDMSDGVAGVQAGAPSTGVDTVYTLVGPAYQSNSYQCKWTYRSDRSTVVISANIIFHCPYGGTPNGESCVNVPDGGGPPPENPCADKNPMIRRYNYGPTGPYVSPDNFGGCIVTPVEMMACHKSLTGSFCYWKIVRTGVKYTGSVNDSSGGGSQDVTPPPTVQPPVVPSPPIAPPPPATPDICKTCVPCPKGTVQAGISSSGIPMCVGTGTNPPPPPVPPPTTVKPPVSSTGADGTVTKVQDTVQTNVDGSTSTTTTTTTTKPDGTVSSGSTTAVSNSAAGSPGRTDAPQDDKYNLCKQNPTLSICRESTVAGTCGEITCTGDAIQCSTLRAAAAMECKMRTDEDALKATPAYVLGAAALAGSDPAAATLPTVKTASLVDVGAMTNEGWLGAGQAFSDVSFTIQGKSITVPLNEWSGYLVGLRYALMVMATLIAFRMLSGVILRD